MANSAYLREIYQQRLSAPGTFAPPTVVFSSEEERESLTGGVFHYLPEGPVAVRSDRYTQELLTQNLYAEYMASIMGKPQPTVITKGQLESDYQGARVIAAHFTPLIVEQAHAIGFPSVTDIYYQWNHKARVQEAVTEVLGPEYATNAIFVRPGMSLTQIGQQIEQKRVQSRGEFVIRIPNAHICSGGGHGVLFARSLEEVRVFLENFKLLNAKDEVIDELLVEEKFNVLTSPSTTFFLEPAATIPLTVNSQILHCGNFIGGTNILAAEITPLASKLMEKGFEVAEYARKSGAQGFLGLDWMVLPNGTSIAAKANLGEMDEEKKIIEMNYRETGNTIPWWMATQRATGFQEDADFANFVFVLGIQYNNTLPNYEAALTLIQQNGMLFEGKHRDSKLLDTPRCIPMYGLQPADFDMVAFWEKGTMSPEEGFAQLNALLEQFKAPKYQRLSVPQINSAV